MLCVLQIDVAKYRVTLYLARKYNLYCDLVYQRQWHYSSFSVTFIQDSLVSTHSLLVHYASAQAVEVSGGIMF